MKQITQRLLADMRWRLSAAGARHKPTRRERDSWGSPKLPWTVPLLGGCAGQAIALGLAISAFDAGFFAGGFLAAAVFLIGIPLAFLAAGLYQQHTDLGAYRRLVTTNERFALVEYSRLLHRQIQAAKSDPTLGGVSEVARLSDLLAKISMLIREGEKQATGQSSLAAEAELAASVLEAYAVGKDSGLSELDARLPEELRARLDELDAEAGQEPESRSKALEP